MGLLSVGKTSSTIVRSTISGAEVDDDDPDLGQSKEEQLLIQYTLEKSMIDVKYK